MVTGFLVDLANVGSRVCRRGRRHGDFFHVNKIYCSSHCRISRLDLGAARGHTVRWKLYFLWACGFLCNVHRLGNYGQTRLADGCPRMTVIPSLHFDSSYLVMRTGLVGTTIAPWQFFYLQAGIRREKKVSPRPISAGPALMSYWVASAAW